MRKKSQEDLAARIRLGQRPKQRQSAARRKGRTTSELLSDEVYDCLLYTSDAADEG